MWPTTPAKGKQAIISKWDAGSASGFALIIDEQGCVALQMGDGKGGITTVSTQHQMLPRRWYRVGAAYEGGTGRVACIPASR